MTYLRLPRRQSDAPVPLGSRCSSPDAGFNTAAAAAQAVDSREAEQPSPEVDAPVEPAAAAAAVELEQALMRMFLTAEEGPIASGSAAAASEATVGYCVDLL